MVKPVPSVDAELSREQSPHSVINRTDNQPVSVRRCDKTGEVHAMHTYRCYLLNARSHIASVEVIECRDDRAAVQRAEQILDAQPTFSGIEVWEWDRRVHVKISSDAIGVH